MSILTRRRAIPVILAIAAIAAGWPCHALTDEVIFLDFRFSLINPGARSAAMGGAFVSLADDATAAAANPAGLTRLYRPEAFGEIRYASVDDSVTSVHGVAPGATTNTETLTQFDDAVFPSFLSYVHPWRDFSFGVSRQEVIHNDSETGNTYEFQELGFSSNTPGSLSVRAVNWNLSFGWKAMERLRLGATVSMDTLDLDSLSKNFVSGEAYSGLLFSTTSGGSDTALTFNLGALWLPKDNLSFGFAYRQGADYTVDETISAQRVDAYQGSLEEMFQHACGVSFADQSSCTFGNRLHMPDTFSLGASWRPIDALTLSLDVARVQYSNLLDGFQTKVNPLTWDKNYEDVRYKVDDQTNLHFGAEYMFALEKGAILLRAGFHQDQDNRIRADFPPSSIGLNPLSTNETFPGRDDLNHFTLGAGFQFSNKVQLDVSGDVSSETSEMVTSFIYRF